MSVIEAHVPVRIRATTLDKLKGLFIGKFARIKDTMFDQYVSGTVTGLLSPAGSSVITVITLTTPEGHTAYVPIGDTVEIMVKPTHPVVSTTHEEYVGLNETDFAAYETHDAAA